jgi:pyruvate kinase
LSDNTVPADRALSRRALDRLTRELTELRAELLAGEAGLADAIDAVHPDHRASARNLAHYLALRRFDIRALQLRLARVGLSSLGASESHVLVSIDRVLGMLALARAAPPLPASPRPVGFREGDRILAANARRLLGVQPSHRAVRIVVTLPREAAEDPTFAHDLMTAGMDCARINCGRDDAAVWHAIAANVRAASDAHGRTCRILVDLGGPKVRTGAIAGRARRLLLSVGDRFELVFDDGRPRATPARSLPRIACAVPDVFRNVEVGQPIWFDDGTIGGIIEARAAELLRIRVTSAKPDGSKLRPERGINLPDTALDLPALTDKDRRDLAEVVAWADVIELSFVQRPDDVRALHDALREHDADDVGIVLKIETRRGFAELPQLLLAAMQRRSCGVMIARGDLAVEVGFERIPEIQEEILWVAEAAHLPTIWATQVLGDLAGEGIPSRAEMTDAAMSARAEAVMLNKGPFIIDAIGTLDDILARMQQHQAKKRSRFGPLRISRALWH